MNSLLSEYFGSAERQYVPDMLSIVGGVETTNEAFETFMRIGGDGLLEENPIEVYGKGEKVYHAEGASTVDYSEFIIPDDDYTGGSDDETPSNTPPNTPQSPQSTNTLDITQEIDTNGRELEGREYEGSYEYTRNQHATRERYAEEVEEFIQKSGIFDV